MKPDPYADPQAYIEAAVGRLGTPLDAAGIQAQAQSQISPLVQALTQSIGREAQAGTAAIGGYTSELAKSLAPFQQSAANIYGGAQQAQAASDSALAQRLSGGGAQEAQDLGAKLGSINAPNATGQAVAGATQDASGAGNALYGRGSASLANLIASGAAEQSYDSKLPALAGLSGLQQTGQLQSQLAGKQADELANIQGQVPGIVQGLQGQQSDLLNRQETLRQNLNQFFSDRQLSQQDAKTKADQVAFEQAVAAKTLGLKAVQTRAGIAQGNARVNQGNARIAQGWAKLTESEKTLQLRQAVDAANIKLRGQSNAISQQNANTSAYRAQTAAQVAAARAAKTANPKLTPNAVATISAKAAKDAEDLYHGVSHQNAQGQTIVSSYTQTYQDALKTLLNRYPSLGRAGATALVNSWYKPGQFGRPKAAPKPVTLGPKVTSKGPLGVQGQVPR